MSLKSPVFSSLTGRWIPDMLRPKAAVPAAIGAQTFASGSINSSYSVIGPLAGRRQGSP